MPTLDCGQDYAPNSHEINVYEVRAADEGNLSFEDREANMSEIRPIDAIAFEKKIQQHDLWNKEGVIELIRLMPTLSPRYDNKQEGEKDA